jgi:hypothetical protein
MPMHTPDSFRRWHSESNPNAAATEIGSRQLEPGDGTPRRTLRYCVKDAQPTRDFRRWPQV